MNILHYSLGLPPYRSGGLTLYVTSIIDQQKDNGHNLFLLYPGSVNFNYPKMEIIQKKHTKNISIFELKNPYPIPLLYGVREPQDFYYKKGIKINIFKEFLQRLSIDIVHLHTIMGLPIEFLEAAHSLKIKIIFTTHDYYGLCLKVNFINEKQNLCNTINAQSCAYCNINSPKTLFLRIRNEHIVLQFKKLLRKILSKNAIIRTSYPIKYPEIPSTQINNYKTLIQYYQNIFQLIDKIHFNSTTTKEHYLKYIKPNSFVTIPITNSNIKDNRSLKKFNKEKLKIGFIGSTEPYKGFPILKKILLKIQHAHDYQWNLYVYGGNEGIDNECKNIIYKGKYSVHELKKIYDSIDLLIVPSTCKETFSFVTLEALSYGTPTIVSHNVGAKDIVKEYNSKFIYKTEIELYNLILELLTDRNELINFNRILIEKQWSHSIQEHCQKIEQYLYKY